MIVERAATTDRSGFRGCVAAIEDYDASRAGNLSSEKIVPDALAEAAARIAILVATSARWLLRWRHTWF